MPDKHAATKLHPSLQTFENAFLSDQLLDIYLETTISNTRVLPVWAKGTSQRSKGSSQKGYASVPPSPE